MRKLKFQLSYPICAFFIMVTLLGCVRKMEGLIVKDAKGNYYELTGNGAIGAERYMLKEIDTLKVVPVGFNCNQ